LYFSDFNIEHELEGIANENEDDDDDDDNNNDDNNNDDDDDDDGDNDIDEANDLPVIQHFELYPPIPDDNVPHAQNTFEPTMLNFESPAAFTALQLGMNELFNRNKASLKMYNEQELKNWSSDTRHFCQW
jgi:hypothetical protein